MGNISTGEKIAIGFFGILLSPFIFVYNFVIKPIGEATGLIKKEEYSISEETQALQIAIAEEERKKAEEAAKKAE